MIEKLRKILTSKELKERIFFTLFVLAICRIGAYIPVPGINGEEVVKVAKFASGGGQNLLQLVDMFTGGAFAHMTITALGVMPYISASIIMQMLMMIVPSMTREMKESPDQGKRKMSRNTRMLTILFAVVQATFFARHAIAMNLSHPGILYQSILSYELFYTPILFYALVIVTMTSGTLVLMWLGEQISEKGVGNGVSLIITLGIIASFPSMIGSITRSLNLDSQEAGELSFTSLFVLSSVFVCIVLGTILAIQGVRKIPLQYARRNEEGTTASFIPLKINFSGVIPVIIANSVLMLPATVTQFMSGSELARKLAHYLSPGSFVYMSIYVVLILFFTYIWTANQFNPQNIVSEMKRHGAFVPGIRQGKPTEEYLDYCMNRITLLGGIFLAVIAILPTIVGKLLSVGYTISHFFGGTSLLILIGVVLDTTKQIDSYLIANKYDGFMSRKVLR
ncbi:MAG: preprotein translocase subunit SecY [Chlamydiae bacterium RIFCSPHIGHO2_12_FULL_49_11]|nr:MAG: preprotein translocase subunit SecY [Chlamydiae bacterium RIFCSPHIGHO2_12_FULL_49_11]